MIEFIDRITNLKASVPDIGADIEWIVAGDQISSFVMSRCKTSGIKYLEFRVCKNVAEKLNSAAASSSGEYFIFVDRNSLPSPRFISQIVWRMPKFESKPYIPSNELARKLATCIGCSRRDFFLLSGFNESMCDDGTFKELCVRISNLRPKNKVKADHVFITDPKIHSRIHPGDYSYIRSLSERGICTGNFGDFGQEPPIGFNRGSGPVSFGNISSRILTDFSVSFIGFVKTEDDLVDILMNYSSQPIDHKELVIVLPEDLNTDPLKHIDWSQNVQIVHKNEDLVEKIHFDYSAVLFPGYISMPNRFRNQIDRLVLEQKECSTVSRVTVVRSGKMFFSKDAVWVGTFICKSGLMKELVTKFPNIKKGILFSCSLGSHVSVDSPRDVIVLDDQKPIFEYKGERETVVQLNGPTFLKQIEEVCRYRPSISFSDLNFGPSASLSQIPKNIVIGKPNQNWDPHIISNCRKSFKQHFDKWNTLSYRDSEYLSEFEPLFKSPQVTDRTKDLLGRLLMVYHFGGISVDADVFVIDVPEKLLSVGFFVGSQFRNKISLCMFGAEPKNHVLGKIIEDIKATLSGPRDLIVSVEQSAGLIQFLFDREASQDSDILVLPTYCLSAFRSPPVAQTFIRSDDESRSNMLAKVSFIKEYEMPIIGVNGCAGKFKFSETENFDFPRTEASTSEMIKSVTSEGIGTLLDIARGKNPLISKQESQKRYEKCAGNESSPKCNFFNPENGKCSKCGCIMRWKVRRAKSVCPVGFW